MENFILPILSLVLILVLFTYFSNRKLRKDIRGDVKTILNQNFKNDQEVKKEIIESLKLLGESSKNSQNAIHELNKIVKKSRTGKVLDKSSIDKLLDEVKDEDLKKLINGSKSIKGKK